MGKNSRAGTDLVAGILAGGRSRRLGVDKAFIRWRGMNLLEHAIRSVSCLTPDVYILAKDVQPYRGFGCPVLPDRSSVSTPLSGIVTIAPLVSEWLLLTACDIAVLRQELFRELWIHRAQDRATVLQSPEGLQPFAALYPAELLHMWAEAFQRGRYRLQLTLEEMPKTILSISELEKKYRQSPLLVNVNSPDDLRRLEVLADGMRTDVKIRPAAR